MSRRLMLIACVMVGTAGYLRVIAASDLVPTATRLSALPLQIGEWRGRDDGRLDRDTEAILQADAYVRRTYTRGAVYDSNCNVVQSSGFAVDATFAEYAAGPTETPTETPTVTVERSSRTQCPYLAAARASAGPGDDALRQSESLVELVLVDGLNPSRVAGLDRVVREVNCVPDLVRNFVL